MKIEFDALQEIAAGFNYAFDAYWLLPLARSIYTHLVRRAIQVGSHLIGRVSLNERVDG